MDDRSEQPESRTQSDRARTLVLRCWFESEGPHRLVLRGTLRDLSRGRSIPFEGFHALVLQLGLAIGDPPPPAAIPALPPS